MLTLIFSMTNNARQIITSMMAMIWAFRLGGFLLFRVLKTGSDTRFDESASRHRGTRLSHALCAASSGRTQGRVDEHPKSSLTVAVLDLPVPLVLDRLAPRHHRQLAQGRHRRQPFVGLGDRVRRGTAVDPHLTSPASSACSSGSSASRSRRQPTFRRCAAARACTRLMRASTLR